MKLLVGIVLYSLLAVTLPAQTADKNNFIDRHKRIPPATAKITCVARKGK